MLTEVSSNETQYKEDGTFLRKLIIDPVTEDHAGTYFCMAQNPSGFTLSATELIVSDREYLVNSLIDSSIF
jgi:Immunoglobulin domain